MTIYKDVLETIRMIEKENLDIRTTTMGISLLDCFGRDHKAASARVYDKITRLASRLVETANEVGEDYGIKVVNKRISVTPIALAAAETTEDWLLYAKALDSAAKAVGVDIIGGFSALVQKGCTPADESFIEAVPYAGRDRRYVLKHQPGFYEGRHQHGCGQEDGTDDQEDGLSDERRKQFRMRQVCCLCKCR